ncbi:MAG: hypothetical protein DWQ10_06050 [Calditrichaeota bacterium]|nr:MAG: hypothetical protein DWQ10_06050 [Calditrichota bacterium]
MQINDSFYSRLIELAILGLKPLYDDQQKLFTKKYANKELIDEEYQPSFIYTATTVLGLIRARKAGWNINEMNESEILDALVNRINAFESPGILGLMLWADSHSDGIHAKTLYQAIKDEVHDEKINELPTYELSWLLTGLSYAHQNIEQDVYYKELVSNLYNAITFNMNSDAGLFGYRTGGTWPATMRNKIGNFADQIYSVYALSTYSDIFKISKALEQALQCANRLCELQGDKGQWWWHYHSKKNIIAANYPVYGVHQSGMTPMTLFKLSEVSGQDFKSSILRGVNWLTGDNELGIEMIDWQNNIIWRDIKWKQPRASLKYLSMATATLGMNGISRLVNRIPAYKVNHEMRSYHLGWVLYAFADKYSPQKGSSKKLSKK